MKKGMILSLATVLLLVGCGQQNEMLEEFDTEQELVKSDNTDLADDAIEDYTEETEAGYFETEIRVNDDVKIQVKAPIPSEGKEAKKIIKVPEKLINGDYLEEIAKRIFDNEEFEDVKPYCVWTKEDLIGEKARFEVMNKEALAGYSISDARLDEYIQYSSDKPQIQLMDGDEHIYECTYDMSSDDEEPCQMERMATFRGTIDGKEYELCYEEHIGEGKNRQKNLWVAPLFPVSSAGEDLYTIIMKESTSYVESEIQKEYDQRLDELLKDTEISEEKLDATAKHVLLNMGFKNLELGESTPICKVGQDGRESELCGYTFCYYIDNFEAKEESLMEMVEFNRMKTTISVDMDEDGVRSISFDDYYLLDQITSEETNIMPLEQAVELAKGYISSMKIPIPKNTDSLLKAFFGDMNETVNYIHMDYRVSEEYNGQTVVMPKWIFGIWDEEEFGTGAVEIFDINAVDGSFGWTQEDYFICGRHGSPYGE